MTHVGRGRSLRMLVLIRHIGVISF
jgi:hypothetical protein